MTGWRSEFVESNNLRIHLTRTPDPGTNNPPIILTHGITDSGLCWSRVARMLEDQHELIMIDARGHGESDKPEAGYAPTDHAADVAGVIRSLGLEKPILLGHSMGAYTGIVLAASEPDLLSALILEDPPIRDVGAWDPTERAEAKRTRREAILLRQTRTREELIEAEKQNSPKWHEDELEPWSIAKHQVSPNVVNYIDDSFNRWPEWIEGIQCPTLMITADTEEGAIVSPEISARIHSLNANVQVVEVQEAGHNIRRENFDAYMAVVQEFLTRISKR